MGRSWILIKNFSSYQDGLRLNQVYSHLRAGFNGVFIRAMSDKAGSGAGKGGGSGGSVRDAGGAFGEMEAAREGEYFKGQQAKQLEDLKKSLKKTKDFHEEQIEDLEKQLKAHKKSLESLKKMDTE